MKTNKRRSILLFLYIVFSIYGFGACMLDYFGIYETWKLVGEKEFPALHQFQSGRIVAIFVIPLAMATVLGLMACLFPPANVSRQLLWLSMMGMALVWVFSFAIQIPMQLALHAKKDMQLLDELLYTNWFRFAADALQVICILVILGQMIIRQRQPVYA